MTITPKQRIALHDTIHTKPGVYDISGYVGQPEPSIMLLRDNNIKVVGLLLTSNNEIRWMTDEEYAAYLEWWKAKSHDPSDTHRLANRLPRLHGDGDTSRQ